MAILAAALQQPPSNANDAYSSYEVCVKKQVSELIGAGETAEMIVRAAMGACETEHIQAELQLRKAAKYPGTTDTVLAMFDDRTKDAAILQVMRARSKNHARHR